MKPKKAYTEKSVLYSWFKTGAKPTQEQFWAWQEAYWHKNETIPIGKVQDISDLLANKADTSTVEAKADKDLVYTKEECVANFVSTPKVFDFNAENERTIDEGLFVIADAQLKEYNAVNVSEFMRKYQPSAEVSPRYERYDLNVSHPSIRVLSGGCKVVINKTIGVGIVSLDFTCAEHINTNTTLFQFPRECPLPMATVENDLLAVSTSNGEKNIIVENELVPIGQAKKSIYCIEGNSAIKGKVFKNYRHRTTFVLFFND